MTNLYLDTLDDAGRAVLLKLKPLVGRAILGGGTGLALQLGHRKSFDFDLFFKKPISPEHYRLIAGILEESPEKLVDTQDQLMVRTASGVELTLLYYWYPHVYKTIPTESLSLFDKRDIASDKAFALGRRNVWRDYVDLYFIIKEGHAPLGQILEDARARFGNEFSPRLFLAQLTYTDDVKERAVTILRNAPTRHEVELFFKAAVKEYAAREILS